MSIKTLIKYSFHRRHACAWVLSGALVGCGSESEANQPIPDKDPDWPEVNVILTPWQGNDNHVSALASAMLAGVYATFDEQNFDVALSDIRQNVLARVTLEQLIQVTPDLNLAGQHHLQSMALTPSGRLLYLLVSDGNSNALLAYNLNTQKLTNIQDVLLPSATHEQVGLAYFSGALYLGSDNGVSRIEMTRDGTFDQGKIERINLGRMAHDVTVDAVEKTLYLATEQGLFALEHQSTQATQIHHGEQIAEISFSRDYGGQGAAGLYVLKQAPKGSLQKGIAQQGSEVWRVTSEQLKTHRSVELEKYYRPETPWQDFIHSADGSLLFTDDTPTHLREAGDTRLAFEPWLRDEYAQYMRAIKGLIASDLTGNDFSPEGFIHNGLQAHSANKLPIAENVGWVLYLLMLEDAVNGNQDNQALAELIIQRHAGLHPDGLGGVRSVDGHFVRNYQQDGLPHPTNPQMQVYISMKFLPAVYQAAEFYAHNENIADYAQYLRQIFVRSGDVVRGEQRITWESDDFGPFRVNRLMNNETWIFGDLAAAQDPNATVNYDHYTYDRDSFHFDYALPSEPVMNATHPAFIVFGATLILDHHYHGEGWRDLNRNYYSLTQSETDYAGFPYFAAFSAGNNTHGSNNYHADGPVNHPGDYIHFPAVLGFGQHGHIGAMVGGYQAYRNGLRQKMVSGGDDNIQMLTRWSWQNPDNAITGLGIADFWFGAVGLAEAIKPGVTERFRNVFHEPKPHLSLSGNAFNDKPISDTGVQTANFSKITPRKLTAISHSGERVEFGYQRAPFSLPSEQTWVAIEVEDIQGDWVELDDLASVLEGKSPRFRNPDFAHGISDWQQQGGSVDVVSGVNGNAAVLRGNQGEVASLSQAVSLGLDLAGTQYRVSALVTPLDSVTQAVNRGAANGSADHSDAQSQGCLQLAWKRSPDQVQQACLSTQDTRQILSVDIDKPMDDDQLVIRFVADAGRYQFENLALQSFGAPQSTLNGSFDANLQGWTVSNPAVVSRTQAPEEVVSGAGSVKFALNGQPQSRWSRLERDIDISGDPDGTRYLVRFNVGERQLEGAKFDVQFRISNPDLPAGESMESMDWWDAAVVTEESPDVVTAVIRKRPGETRFKLQFRLEQKQTDSRAFVIIDDVTLYKQRLFDAR